MLIVSKHQIVCYHIGGAAFNHVAFYHVNDFSIFK